jgi:hypothetical protein
MLMAKMCIAFMTVGGAPPSSAALVDRQILGDDGLEGSCFNPDIGECRLEAADHLVRSQQPDLITRERSTGKHLQQSAQQFSRPEWQGHQQRSDPDRGTDKLQQFLIDPAWVILKSIVSRSSLAG